MEGGRGAGREGGEEVGKGDDLDSAQSGVATGLVGITSWVDALLLLLDDFVHQVVLSRRDACIKAWILWTEENLGSHPYRAMVLMGSDATCVFATFLCLKRRIPATRVTVNTSQSLATSPPVKTR